MTHPHKADQHEPFIVCSSYWFTSRHFVRNLTSILWAWISLQQTSNPIIIIIRNFAEMFLQIVSSHISSATNVLGISLIKLITYAKQSFSPVLRLKLGFTDTANLFLVCFPIPESLNSLHLSFPIFITQTSLAMLLFTADIVKVYPQSMVCIENDIFDSFNPEIAKLFSRTF